MTTTPAADPTVARLADLPPTAAPAAPPSPGLLARLGRDTGYLLAGLPLAVVSFSLLVTGVALAAGLLVTVAGIPVGVGTLALAVGLGRVERARLALQGTTLPPVRYAAPRGRGWRGMLGRLADGQRWAAVLHGVGALVPAVVTWSLAVTWWAGALGGLTFWFWSRWLPEDNTGLADLLDLPFSDSVLNLALGALFALSLPALLRGCVALHVGWARLLLTGTSRQALAAQVEDLTDRRAAAGEAEAQALRRLERDIHDGPQQRLVRLGMDLSVAERRLASDPDAAREMLGAAREQAAETLAELRALSRGIAPPVLADRGLVAAVAAVAARSTVPATVTADVPDGERPASAVENGAYFVLCEALTNVAKHAGATHVQVHVRGSAEHGLHVEVVDDGVGGASPAKGHGLAGLADRVRGLGGTLTVVSPHGGPTTVGAVLPWR